MWLPIPSSAPGTSRACSAPIGRWTRPSLTTGGTGGAIPARPPRLPRPPPRAVQVVAVASAFTALTQMRAFRSEPFDARGAADVLISETARSRADLNTVRLLVHALRGARGEVGLVSFGRERLGHAPVVNRYTDIAPLRSPV